MRRIRVTLISLIHTKWLEKHRELIEKLRTKIEEENRSEEEWIFWWIS